MSFRSRPFAFLAAAVAGLALVAAGCGGGGDDSGNAGNTPTPRQVTLRLGYFPNITHAQGLIGVAEGTFAESLGENVKLDVKTFNAGPSVIEALFAGEIDVAYIGPNPAINGYVRSNGDALRIVAGSASGGALFVVRPESNIRSAADLAGTRLATPQLGNTQDVALRTYLQEHDLKPRESGGNVNVQPIANPDILALFRRGELDGAWVPEPWATRLVQEAGGTVFLDERDLWPEGRFVTTHLIVRTKFLDQNPEVVERFLDAHVRVTQWINEHPDEAKAVTNTAIQAMTSAALPEPVINSAWQNLEFTWDPIAASLHASADDAFELGFLGNKRPDLSGIYRLDLLNRVLERLGLEPVKEG